MKRPVIDLRPDHRKIVEDILRDHLPDAVKVWVFGSRAEWTTKESSDLDLALEGHGPLDPRVVMALDLAFEGSLLPFSVDVVDLLRVDDGFREIVDCNRVVLMERRMSVHQDAVSNDVGLGELELRHVAQIVMGQSPPGATYNEHRIGLPFFQGVKDFTYRNPVPRVFCSAPSRVARDGDILLSVRAPIGRVNVADRECAIGRGLSIIRPKRSSDARYLEFVLRHLERSWLAVEGSGSVFGNATKRDLETLRVPWFTELERLGVANVLGALDDRIELTRRMNQTLEGMARALFKSWFVDFDPVRAKMEGRDPGLPSEIADLFPDRLVDSELGRIPEGWINGCLADIADSPRRIVDPRDLEGDTPYIGLEHMPRRSVALWEWSHAANVTSTKYLFEKGEILFGKLRPYFHKVGIAPCHGVCSTDIVVITPKKPAWSSFVLTCASSDDFVQHSNRASTGTKMPRTSWKVMRTYPLCLPSEDVVRQFQRLVGPWVDCLVGNISSRLANSSLRDALLSKLVSGEVRLPAALVDRGGRLETPVGS